MGCLTRFECILRLTTQALLDGLMLAVIADIRTELLRLGTRKPPYLLIPRLNEYAPRVDRDYLFALLAGYGLLIRRCKRRVVICSAKRSWLLQNSSTSAPGVRLPRGNAWTCA